MERREERGERREEKSKNSLDARYLIPDIEIHVDTYDFGFEFWIDGLSFTPFYTGTEQPPSISEPFEMYCFPNPASNEVSIGFTLDRKLAVALSLVDLDGRMVSHLCIGSEYGNLNFQ